MVSLSTLFFVYRMLLIISLNTVYTNCAIYTNTEMLSSVYKCLETPVHSSTECKIRNYVFYTLF